MPQTGKQPNTAEFRVFVEQTHPSMRRLVYRLVGNQMEDVLQEAYLSAFQAFDSFRGEAKAETWLYRIVYNTCVDHLRRQSRRVATDPLDSATPSKVSTRPGLDPAAQVANRIDLASAMDTLSIEQRAALMLVDAEGMSFRAAGEVLGLPTGTVASRVSRARETLRQQLKENQNG